MTEVAFEEPHLPTNKNGLLTQWSRNSDDGVTLKLLVENGVIEGMSAAKVKAKYVQFKKYTPRTFSSALTGLRQTFNNQLHERRSAILPPSQTFARYPENGDGLRDNDEEEDNWDSATRKTAGTLGFKSVAFKEHVSTPYKASPILLKSSNKYNPTSTTGIVTIMLPFVVDEWSDRNALLHLSLQIQLLSGASTDNVFARVSTDQKHFVITQQMSSSLTNSFTAFSSSYDEDNLAHDTTIVHELKNHPKVIAREMTLAKMKNRDSTKKLTYEQRIPLPFRCLHDPSTEKNDPLYHGMNFVEHHDGSIHLHVELLCDHRDNYHVHPENLFRNFNVSGGSVPNEIRTHRSSASVASSAVRSVQSRKSRNDDVSVMSTGTNATHNLALSTTMTMLPYPPLPDSPLAMSHATAKSNHSTPNGFVATPSQKRQAIVKSTRRES